MPFARLSLACVAALLGAALPAAAPALRIVSGSDWSSTGTDPGGLEWTQPGFDDGAWIPAFSPYPNPTPVESFLSNSPAEFMWYWNAPTPPTTGLDGPLEAWFRYEFTLAPTDFPASGRGLVLADDYFALYVNGHFVADGFLDERFNVFPVDFGAWLVPGDNVLAIRAFDGFHTGPADRTYESALFDGSISIVPEPATLALLAGGLAGMAMALRRRPG